jgi:hypothetical protein
MTYERTPPLWAKDLKRLWACFAHNNAGLSTGIMHHWKERSMRRARKYQGRPALRWYQGALR